MPEPLRPTIAIVWPGSTRSGDPVEDRRRLRAAVAEADVDELDLAGERLDGQERGAVGALLGLLVDHVVEAADQDPGELELVPEQEQQQDGPVRERDERVERDELAHRQRPVDDLRRADDEERRERDEPEQLDAALVGEDEELRLEEAGGERPELRQHRRPQRLLGRHRLDRLDPADRVDLVRRVLPVGLLEALVHRLQPPRREPEQPRVERHGREEDEREHPAVDEHERDGGEDLRGGGQRLHAAADEELPHLAQPGEPALDVAGAPRREVRHREVEQLPGEEVERVGVDLHRDPGEEVALDERGRRDREQDGDERGEHDPEEPDVAVGQNPVDDDLRHDRQDELQPGRDEGQ